MEQNIAVIDCLCGTRLRADLSGFRCPNCKKQLMLFEGRLREFEDGVIVEDSEINPREYNKYFSIGIFNLIKLNRRRKHGKIRSRL